MSISNSRGKQDQLVCSTLAGRHLIQDFTPYPSPSLSLSLQVLHRTQDRNSSSRLFIPPKTCSAPSLSQAHVLALYLSASLLLAPFKAAASSSHTDPPQGSNGSSSIPNVGENLCLGKRETLKCREPLPWIYVNKVPLKNQTEEQPCLFKYNFCLQTVIGTFKSTYRVGKNIPFRRFISLKFKPTGKPFFPFLKSTKHMCIDLKFVSQFEHIVCVLLGDAKKINPKTNWRKHSYLQNKPLFISVKVKELRVPKNGISDQFKVISIDVFFYLFLLKSWNQMIFFRELGENNPLLYIHIFYSITWENDFLFKGEKEI